jgi:hypothetical protein
LSIASATASTNFDGPATLTVVAEFDRQAGVVEIEVAKQRRHRFAGHRRKRDNPAAHVRSRRDMHRLAVEIPDEAVSLYQLDEDIARRVVEAAVDRSFYLAADVGAQALDGKHVAQHIGQWRAVHCVVNRCTLPNGRRGVGRRHQQYGTSDAEQPRNVAHGFPDRALR